MANSQDQNRTNRSDAKKNEHYSEMQPSSQFDKNTREPSQSSAGTMRDADTAKTSNEKGADRNAATGAPGQGKAIYGKGQESSGGMVGEGGSTTDRYQTDAERREMEALQAHEKRTTSARVDDSSSRKSSSDY